jgi:ABC-2 type transport system ATP-binding protein
VTDEIALSAEGLVKRFRTSDGWNTAVDHLTLQVRHGETYGLIGPDGAGKTTSIRLLLGLLSRKEGKSSILGFDSMIDTYELRERVGYIAQQFVLPADLTVMENMRFFANIQGVADDAQKKNIPELLAFAGLTDYTGRLAGQLSGGMKKKLALACSLVHAPQVVLLDEPTLGVDPVSRREFWNLLGNLRAERGMTIFVCTPYMDEAERCTHIGLIYEGKLVASDTPNQIKRMVNGELLELTPSQFVPAQELMNTLEGVLEVQTYGERLHIFVDEAQRRKPQIEMALATQGITHQGIRRIEVRMEEAFISLIRRQTRAGEKSNTDTATMSLI